MNEPKRSLEVDSIRLAALLGICIVNLPFMGLPVESVFYPPDGWHNKAAVFLVECLFQLKFFTLFSFIFGWGLAIQEKNAVSKGQPLRQRYFRRMAGLLVLGVLHATLVFSGDILALYALLGTALWILREKPARTLTRIALCMIPLSMLCLGLLALIIETYVLNTPVPYDTISTGNTSEINLGGNYADTLRYRLADWPGTFAFLVLLQGPLAFAAFLTGLAAAKSNFFAANSSSFALLQLSLIHI